MSTPIRAAVEALHASREALPEAVRDEPWLVEGLLTNAVVRTEGGSYVVGTSDEYSLAEHIALVASPHVVEALEQLLTAIHEHDQADDPHSWETCFIDVRHNADALAAALTRRTA